MNGRVARLGPSPLRRSAEHVEHAIDGLRKEAEQAIAGSK
jgi:hypothetical protein